MISPTPSSLLGARSNTLLTSYYIFSELVGCKSMSEAAWNLDLDVSVVSRHVAAIEETFGCNLFDRHGRGVRLTTAGQVVVCGGRGAQREFPEAFVKRRVAECAFVDLDEDGRTTMTVGRQPAELTRATAFAVAVDDLCSLHRPFSHVRNPG